MVPYYGVIYSVLYYCVIWCDVITCCHITLWCDIQCHMYYGVIYYGAIYYGVT